VRPSIFLAGCLLVMLPHAGQAESPRLADERIVLHTVAGDVVVGLYPDVAPEHVHQILQLVRLGCYDHTTFFRVEPDFVIQLAGVEGNAQHVLTPAQIQAIHPIKGEFSDTLKHRRGVLSMARADGKPDSATTSFSIMLGDAPHLDGQFTIFGKVVRGMDVVDKLIQVPPKFGDPGTPPVPLVPLEVESMEIVSVEDLESRKLAPAHDVAIPPEVVEQAHKDAWTVHRATLARQQSGSNGLAFETAYLQTGGLLLVILLSLASFLGAGRLSLRWIISLNMLIVLVAAFMLLVLLTPYAQQQWILAVLLFVAFFGIFRLLSRFESVG
jgi:cyclophilin family peptidyl-prolyl cis-trans isomerase